MRKLLFLLATVVTLTLGGVVNTACSAMEEEITVDNLVGRWQLESVYPKEMAQPCDFEGPYIFYKEGAMDVRTSCDDAEHWVGWKLHGDVLTVALQNEQQDWRVRELTANRLVLERSVEQPDYALSPSRATAQSELQRMVFKRIK